MWQFKFYLVENPSEKFFHENASISSERNIKVFARKQVPF